MIRPPDERFRFVDYSKETGPSSCTVVSIVLFAFVVAFIVNLVWFWGR